MKVEVVDNLVEARWSKLVWNIPFNGSRSPRAASRPTGSARTRARRGGAGAHARGPAGRGGVRLRHPRRLPRQAVRRSRRRWAPYQPSSLVDFLAGREVEVEAIWGEPLRRAQAAGVRMPRLESFMRGCSPCAPRPPPPSPEGAAHPAGGVPIISLANSYAGGSLADAKTRCWRPDWPRACSSSSVRARLRGSTRPRSTSRSSRRMTSTGTPTGPGSRTTRSRRSTPVGEFRRAPGQEPQITENLRNLRGRRGEGRGRQPARRWWATSTRAAWTRRPSTPRGAAPLQPELDKIIAAVQTPADVMAEVAHLQSMGPVGFGFFSSADAKDSDMDIAQLRQGGLGLPDRDYYINDDDKSKKIRDQYVEHVSKTLQLLGDAPAAPPPAESGGLMPSRPSSRGRRCRRRSCATPMRATTRCRSPTSPSTPATSTGRASSTRSAARLDQVNFQQPGLLQGLRRQLTAVRSPTGRPTCAGTSAATSRPT
jgi:hypothetical protein